MKIARKPLGVFCGMAVLTATGAASLAGSFDLGKADNYAILFEGGAGNTLSITNVTTNTTGSKGQGGGVGNIGVGNTGQATDSGPSTINGSIDFSAANTGQFSNNNGANVITGGVHYNVSNVTSGLNTVNDLNTMLGNLSGTDLKINGNNVSVNNGAQTTTLNVTSGTFHSADFHPVTGAGYTNVDVFNVTSFALNNGENLTINGNGSDAIVLNFTSATNFHGNVVLTGGITPDQVLFNFVGGSGLTGGPTLDINNGGGSSSHALDYLSQGIFLDPNGTVSVVNSNVLGRVFGGDSHDFQYVSGDNLTAPTPTGSGGQGGETPLPSTALAGIALMGGLLLAGKLRRARIA